MKLRATYHKINFNPFLPRIEDFCNQIRRCDVEIPDDSDMEEMRRLAEEATPDGFVFVRLEHLE